MGGIARISVLLAMVLFLVNSVLGDTWQTTIVDPLIANNTSLELDSGDHAHISYMDWNNQDLKYAHWNGVSWDISSVDTQGNVGRWSSLDLDSDDHPHISYAHLDPSALKYAYWNGSSWEIATPCSVYANPTSIAVDSYDYPSIAHCDGVLKYSYWSGTTWYTSVVDPATGCGYFASLALETIGANYPHIAYYDFTNGDLKYACFEETYWYITTLDSSGDTGWDLSIDLDSSDHPHISYSCYDPELRYAYYNGTSWNFTTLEPGGGSESSLVLDSNDHPHISYGYSNGTSYDLRYAYFNGSSWELTVVETGLYACKYTSIALDSNDNPHISYRGGGDLKYAWYGATGIEEGETSEDTSHIIGVYPNPSRGTVEISFTVSAVSSVEFQIFDLSGRIVLSTSSEYDQGQHCLELNDLTSGMYLVQMQVGDSITSGQFVIID